MHKKTAMVGVILAASIAGCQTKAGTVALVGVAGGAAVGGLIGSASHARAGEGAVIGGALGALGGALVGNQMDKSDQRERDRQEQRDRAYEQSQAAYDRGHDRAYDARAHSPIVTRSDVIDWHRQGVKDEIIIDRIQRSGTTFSMTT